MAGRGYPPKPPSTRSRKGAAVQSERVIPTRRSSQPRLPNAMPGGERWPAQTVKWWRMWAASPLAREFVANDWSELADTAVLHGAYWSGDLKLASELRLRVANFGATPADRARLRITFAMADSAESRAEGRCVKKPTGKRPPDEDPRAALYAVS